MKRITISTLFVILLFFVSSCEKDDVNNMEGTWDYGTIEHKYSRNPQKNYTEYDGGHIVIKDGTITFYSENEFFNGTPMTFEYKEPHIFIAGFNTYDMVSITKKKMIWKETYSDDGEEVLHNFTKR